MDQRRRNQYLHALGIPVYISRPSFDCVAGDAPDNARPPSDPPPFQPPSTAAALDALRAKVADCTRCALCQTRTQTVFGAGAVGADCMFIGEGPGAEEDRRGEPFVGRAGQLLNRMLAAIDLSRSQVYIANIVKCRPPHNRDPKAEEITACQDHLHRQIQLVRPRAIVTIGRVAAQHLLQSTASIKQLRERQHWYPALDIPVLVTYHPAYLLRNPIDKRKSWGDLKRLRTLLASPPTT